MANKDDNPTFKEAMAGPDAGGFITVMEAEILTLTGLKLMPHICVMEKGSFL
jgi:hypothetical protein